MDQLNQLRVEAANAGKEMQEAQMRIKHINAELAEKRKALKGSEPGSLEKEYQVLLLRFCVCVCVCVCVRALM
jgi:hypothetical protein